MVVGKIISIFDISIEVILNEESNIKIGDILKTNDDKNYSFEVVSVNNVSATCISLNNTRGLKKGIEVIKLSEGIDQKLWTHSYSLPLLMKHSRYCDP